MDRGAWWASPWGHKESNMTVSKHVPLRQMNQNVVFGEIQRINTIAGKKRSYSNDGLGSLCN